MTNIITQRKWPEERIPIDLEPIPGFNLRAQVVGHGGAYVKHIQTETRCRVQIKGRGSGFYESSTGAESDEPMYLHVAGPDPNEVKHARELCEDLLANVKEQYQMFKERGGQRGGRGGYGGGGGGDRGGDHYSGRAGGGYDQQQQPEIRSYDGYGGALTAGGATPQADPNAPMAGMSYEQAIAQAEAYAPYYAQQPGGDPYAAYGGIVEYTKMYYQYYGGQATQPQSQGTPAGYGAPGGHDAQPGYGTPGGYQQHGAQGYEQPPPPPPPSTDQAPPPPPPSGQPPGNAGYGAVPPPPGL